MLRFRETLKYSCYTKILNIPLVVELSTYLYKKIPCTIANQSVVNMNILDVVVCFALLYLDFKTLCNQCVLRAKYNVGTG